MALNISSQNRVVVFLESEFAGVLSYLRLLGGTVNAFCIAAELFTLLPPIKKGKKEKGLNLTLNAFNSNCKVKFCHYFRE